MRKRAEKHKQIIMLDYADEALDRICPIPIYQLPTKSHQLSFNGETYTLDKGVYGSCYEEFILLGEWKGKEFTCVSKAHEVGHALCQDTNCFCYQCDAHISEAHAMLYTLKYAMSYLETYLVQIMLDDILRHDKSKKNKYRLGSQYVQCLDFYKKALSFIA